MPCTVTRRRTVVASVVCALAAAPAYAFAVTKNGVTPISPRAGATVPKGKSVTFKGRVSGRGSIFLHVCKSARKSKKGVICKTEIIARAKRKGSTFSHTQVAFEFDEYWLNRPGTYFWQAHRISPEGGNPADVLEEGPVVRFKVG